jgi:hypothetical protein
MDADHKNYLLQKFVQNVIFSAFIFTVWAHFFSWRSYFLFGAMVAAVLLFKQWKLFGKKIFYVIVAAGDIICWPTMLYMDIKGAIK